VTAERISTRRERPGARSWLDAGLAALLIVGTALHCWFLPRAIGTSDEGLFLYEAKRVAEGAVLYRDVFELVTPLSTFLMAALFRAFRADIATARGADALIHGLIVAAVFGIARRLGVRRGIAVAAALLHPAWFRPIWDVSSPHWLSTLFGLGLLAELIRVPARPLLAGVWAGLIIAVQQQRGMPLALAAAAVVVLDHWTAVGVSAPARLARRLTGFCCGIALVILPMGAYVLWTAGARNVFEALVVHPLFNYRRQTRGVSWGANLTPWAKPYTVLALLRWLPVLIPVEMARAAVEFRRGHARWRQSAVLAGYAVAVAASILYLPDVIHIGFVAPVFAILLADQLEGVLDACRSRPAATLLGAGIAVAVVCLNVAQLRRVTAGKWRDYPVAYESAFGRVDFATPAEVALRERVRAALADVPGRRLFIYPGAASIYLEVGAVNPTPFQLMTPAYSRPEHFATVVEILDRERTPYVLRTVVFGGDPLQSYLEREYEQEPPQGPAPPLLRRRGSAATGP
jgi:hypothetical protein